MPSLRLGRASSVDTSSNIGHRAADARRTAPHNVSEFGCRPGASRGTSKAIRATLVVIGVRTSYEGV